MKTTSKEEKRLQKSKKYSKMSKERHIKSWTESKIQTTPKSRAFLEVSIHKTSRIGEILYKIKINSFEIQLKLCDDIKDYKEFRHGIWLSRLRYFPLNLYTTKRAQKVNELLHNF